MNTQERQIAIIGGTGRIGPALVRELLHEGFRLKLLVRSPEKITLKSDRVTLIKGDARDVEKVKDLVKGCYLLVNLIGQTKGEPHVFAEVAKNAITALNSAGIKRYIVIAGLGLQTPADRKRFLTRFLTGIMHLLLPETMKDKKREYKLITGSSLDWTIIRIPKVIMKNRAGEVSVSEADCRSLTIDISKLISFIKGEIITSKNLKKAPFVSN